MQSAQQREGFLGGTCLAKFAMALRISKFNLYYCSVLGNLRIDYEAFALVTLWK